MNFRVRQFLDVLCFTFALCSCEKYSFIQETSDSSTKESGSTTILNLRPSNGELSSSPDRTSQLILDKGFRPEQSEIDFILIPEEDFIANITRQGLSIDIPPGNHLRIYATKIKTPEKPITFHGEMRILIPEEDLLRADQRILIPEELSRRDILIPEEITSSPYLIHPPRTNDRLFKYIATDSLVAIHCIIDGNDQFLGLPLGAESFYDRETATYWIILSADQLGSTEFPSNVQILTVIASTVGMEPVFNGQTFSALPRQFSQDIPPKLQPGNFDGSPDRSDETVENRLTILWEDEFEGANCYDDWKSSLPDPDKIKPECRTNEFGEDVLFIGYQDSEDDSPCAKCTNRYPMLWQSNPLNGYDSLDSFNIEIRFRFLSWTDYGTPVFSIGSIADPGGYVSKPADKNLAGIFSINRHTEGLTIQIDDLEPFIQTGNKTGYYTATIGYTRSTGIYSYSILDDDKVILKTTAAGNQPGMFLIGYPILTDYPGGWAEMEIDYIRLSGDRSRQ